jgi:hypothetical protein
MTTQTPTDDTLAPVSPEKTHLGTAVSPRRGLALLAALAVLPLAACDDDATGPETAVPEELNADVAAMVAESTRDDIQSMALPTLRIFGFPGGPFAALAGQPGFGPGFGPGGGVAPGDVLERTGSVTFLDADGQEMEAFDELLTDRIEAEWTVEGSLDRGTWSASVERTRDLVVTGLAGEETSRTWAGEGSSDVERIRHDDENGDREYRMESSSLIDEVVVGIPRSENPWPLSGSITHQVEVTVINGPNGDVTRQRTAVVTFDGTQFATVTVDGETFEVDLADRQGRRPGRR